MKKTSSTFVANRRRCLGGLALTSLALGLGACGWRIRGKVDLPYKKLLISGNMTPELRVDLDVLLRVNDIEQVKSAKEADLVVEIISEQNARQVLTYNVSGQITAYRIISRLVFRAFDVNGIEVMPESDIYLTRDIDFNQANIQSFDAMVGEYIRTMRVDILTQLMRRLGSIKKKPVKE